MSSAVKGPIETFLGVRILCFERQQLVDQIHVFDVSVLVFSDAKEVDQLISLFRLQFLRKGAENLFDFGAGNVARSVFVEDFEAFDLSSLTPRSATFFFASSRIGPKSANLIRALPSSVAPPYLTTLALESVHPSALKMSPK